MLFIVAELLHTVRLTIRNQILDAEQFLVVGRIAGIRKVLIVTAEAEKCFRWNVEGIELLILAGLIPVMATAVYVWRRSTRPGMGALGDPAVELFDPEASCLLRRGMVQNLSRWAGQLGCQVLEERESIEPFPLVGRFGAYVERCGSCRRSCRVGRACYSEVVGDLAFQGVLRRASGQLLPRPALACRSESLGLGLARQLVGLLLICACAVVSGSLCDTTELPAATQVSATGASSWDRPVSPTADADNRCRESLRCVRSGSKSLHVPLPGG